MTQPQQVGSDAAACRALRVGCFCSVLLSSEPAISGAHATNLSCRRQLSDIRPRESSAHGSGSYKHGSDTCVCRMRPQRGHFQLITANGYYNSSRLRFML
eukprot:3418449-Rhodomonas_salina.2